MLFDKGRTVFISGSAYEYGRFGSAGRSFVRNLTASLLKHDYTLISGFGLGIGDSVVDAALHEVYHEKEDRDVSNYLRVYPFGAYVHAGTVKTCYRKDMISQADIAIFIFGNKLQDIAIREAEGMIEEFQIARANQALLIPVGASGYIAEKLWKEMMDDFDAYFETREKFALYEELGEPYTRHDRLIELILQIAR